MGAHGAESSHALGNQPMTIRELSPVRALSPLSPSTRPKQMFPGQRTLPVSGAPLLPKNPLLAAFLGRSRNERSRR
jgi:hypothetical protein